MRLPFIHPGKDKVTAIATDLISRFGLRARSEALYLAHLSLQMGSRRHKVLYEFVALEIEASFLEAQKRLRLRQSAEDLARLAARISDGNDGGAKRTDESSDVDRLVPHVRLRKADIPRSRVADLNLVDVDPSPRRRLAPR